VEKIHQQNFPLYLTLAYADIFGYPLTVGELHRYLIGKKLSLKRLLSHLTLLTGKSVIVEDTQYLALAGKKRLINLRKKRHIYSKAKWKIAENVALTLSFIPTVRLVGVTGALAMNNAGPDDDIDLYIVVSDNTLWISRILVIVLTELTARRRKPGEREVADAICLNMFTTMSAMHLPKSEHDLYTAHEVLQMQPLWVKGDTYRQFLQDNFWVRRFLPNWWESKNEGWQMAEGRERKVKKSAFSFLPSAFRLFEPLARFIQLKHMKNRRTTEIVSDTILKFHPQDRHVWVRQELEKRMIKLKIPLDKEFWDT
jgi:hypothetical protein